MPLIALSPVGILAANIAGWALAHTITGFVAHRTPSPQLAADRGILRLREFERDARAYEALRIRRWKDRLPEAGALFPGGVSKRRLPSFDADGQHRFAIETRRAELSHWWCLACFPAFALWNPPVGVALMGAYAAAANVPCIVVQRYNRGRVRRIETVRVARRDHGNSIPYGSPPRLVMNAVTSTQPLQISETGWARRDSLVDVHVVHKEIHESVCGDPGCAPEQCRRGTSGEREQRKGKRRHHERKAVVAFETDGSADVMAAVPAEPEAVHDPAVQRVAHEFHHKKRRDDDDDDGHGTERHGARESQVIITRLRSAKPYAYSSKRMSHTGRIPETSPAR